MKDLFKNVNFVFSIFVIVFLIKVLSLTSHDDQIETDLFSSYPHQIDSTTELISIDMAETIALAQVTGAVAHLQLSVTDEYVAYDVQVKTREGVIEVRVDAETGLILQLKNIP